MERIVVKLGSETYNSIEEKVRETMGDDICILFIEKIENQVLHSKFIECKNNIKDVKQMQLFHGTKAESIDSIATFGYDISRNVTSAYGKGTYFSTKASYSFNFMKSSNNEGTSYMFYSDVLVGEKGKDHYEGPDMYITRYNYGAFPGYIIGIYKEATYQEKQVKKQMKSKMPKLPKMPKIRLD